MTLPEFAIGLLQRFAPTGQESMANLKVALLEQHNRQLNNFIMKKSKNQKIMEEIKKVEENLNSTDVHTPEYQEELKKFETLRDKLEKPTLTERALSFFDKPVVKITLMALFALVSWWISKKLTSKKTEEDPEIDEQEHTGYPPHNGGYYPPSPWPPYQPYGYNYGHPPRFK